MPRSADTLEVVLDNDLSEKIMATPAVVDNTLYIRTSGHLYAFSSASKTALETSSSS